MLVSMGHISRGREFRRAFSAALVHDFFNVLSVLILFPLQCATHFLSTRPCGSVGFLQVGRILNFESPIKAAIAPAVHLIQNLVGGIVSSPIIQAMLMLTMAGVLLFSGTQVHDENPSGRRHGESQRFLSTDAFSHAHLGFHCRSRVDGNGPKQFDHDFDGRAARRSEPLDPSTDLSLHAGRERWDDDHRSPGVACRNSALRCCRGGGACHTCCSMYPGLP